MPALSEKKSKSADHGDNWILKKILKVVEAFAATILGVFAVLIFTVLLLPYMLYPIGILFTLSQDGLAVVALLISIVNLLVSCGWNYNTYRMIRDEYEPVLDVKFLNGRRVDLPLGASKFDLEVILSNIGKRKMVPSDVVVTMDWTAGSQKYEIKDDFILPGEKVELTLPLPRPPDGKHKIVLTCSDEERDIVWHKRWSFEVYTLPQ